MEELVLIAPFWLVSEVLLIIALRPGMTELLWLVLLPALLTAFSCVLALWINLRMHSFDWDSETAVVKQSGASMLGGMAGPLVTLVCMGAVLVTQVPFGQLVRALMALALAAACVLLYRSGAKTAPQQL